MRRLLLISLLVVMASAACTPALLEPTLEDATWAQTRWPDLTLEELHEGRALYVRKCSGCHLLRRPEKYTPAEWSEQIEKMMAEQDVELEPVERIRIERYLTVASERTAELAAASP